MIKKNPTPEHTNAEISQNALSRKKNESMKKKKHENAEKTRKSNAMRTDVTKKQRKNP